MNRANRNYTITLLVLVFFFLMTAGEFAFFRRSPSIADSSKWVFQFVTYLYSLYSAAIIVTLILRWRAPSAGRIATTALNIILLFLVPIGTIVGIYGLRKVDKDPPAVA